MRNAQIRSQAALIAVNQSQKQAKIAAASDVPLVCRLRQIFSTCRLQAPSSLTISASSVTHWEHASLSNTLSLSSLSLPSLSLLSPFPLTLCEVLQAS